MNPKPNGRKKFVTVDEFVAIAKAQARKEKLTLVFDQSFKREKNNPPQKQTAEKLRWLKECGVHAFAYVSHANFILASADSQILMKALKLLEDKLPPERLIEL